jgi:hypothetical protein
MWDSPVSHSFVQGAVKLNDRQRIEDMGFGVKDVMDATANAFSASAQPIHTGEMVVLGC